MDQGSGGEVETLQRVAITVAFHGDLWVTYLLNHGRARLTASTYHHSVRYFSESLQAGGLRFEDVTKRTMEAWIAEMRIGGKGPKTIHGRVGAVKVFYSWLFDEGYMPSNPLAGLKPIKVPKKLPRPLSPAQIRALVGKAEDSRDVAFVETTYATGGRLSEILALDIEHLNIDNSTVLLMGKGGVERLQPITAECVRALKAYLVERAAYLKRTGRDNERALFISREGRLNRSSVQLMLSRLGKAAGIGHVHCHQLRHSLGSFLRSRKMDLLDIKEILGHASVKSTEIYAQLAKEELRRNYLDAMGDAGSAR